MRRNINDSQAFKVQVWASGDLFFSGIVMVHPIPHQSPLAALQGQVEEKILPQLTDTFGEGVSLSQSHTKTADGGIRFDVNVDGVRFQRALIK